MLIKGHLAPDAMLSVRTLFPLLAVSFILNVPNDNTFSMTLKQKVRLFLPPVCMRLTSNALLPVIYHLVPGFPRIVDKN